MQKDLMRVTKSLITVWRKHKNDFDLNDELDKIINILKAKKYITNEEYGELTKGKV